jgi:S1-C subfamily serine protease
VAPTWPIYAAGIDQDDELLQLGGQRIGGDADVSRALQSRRPGETLTVVFADRTGLRKTGAITLADDPHLEVVPEELSQGAASLTPAARSFRDRWLNHRP